MAQSEVLRFIRSFSELTEKQRTALIQIVSTDKNTVVVFSSCGEKVCTYFATKNFNNVLGYPSKAIFDEGVQFVISRTHPTDLPSVFQFLEACHRPTATWFEDAEAGSLECTYRFKGPDGGWRWVTQHLLVLTLTKAGLLENVMMTFVDCSIQKRKLAEQHLASLAAKRHNSKLLEALVAAQNKLETLNASNNTYSKLLTAREKEVLELVAKGYSSKQIAEELFISKHTVESHRKNLLQKLQANNAADLIQKAHFVY
jgi:DNA-binding CsgD family transcriptional regulator